MKSMMEEASSIIKAIEKGWTRAGKPKHFSVKILEEPEKNFFGMTTKSAKIALLFEEKPKAVSRPGRRPQKKSFKQPSRYKQPDFQQPRFKKEETTQPEKPTPLWSDEMVDIAKTWIEQSLVHLGLPNINFTATVVGRNLKIQFSSQVLENSRQEKFLFSSFAHLILETLRNKFKRHFRNIGVILTSSHETTRI